MSSVALFYHPEMLQHAPDGYDPAHPEWTERVKRRLGNLDEGGMSFTHPERPERLEAIIESLRAAPIDGLEWHEPAPASHLQKARVHTQEHLELLESYRDRSGWLHHDTTAVSEGSIHAADLSAGAACEAVETVLDGAVRRSFALSRPPGHHAYANKSRGFCLLNNVAIAVQHAREQHGVERVLVVDWDAHHGNGTQAIFRGDPNVMHFDIHADAPVYPGSGPLFDTGDRGAIGTLINVPLPPKTGDAVMLEALDDILMPAAIRFQPELIVVSAGFDGHRADLLFEQTDDGFAAMTGRLLDLASLLTDGRIAFVLEGGYREALSASVRACLTVMAGREPPKVALGGEDPGRANLQLAASFHNRPVYY